MKYLRTLALEQDPAFNGTVRDVLNFAEKFGTIDSAELWMEIRELRNISAHEYLDEKLSAHFKRVRDLTPHVLAIIDRLQ